MANTDHSRMSPSATERWIVCPGSAAKIPPEQPSNPASEKGHVDHARAADILKNKKRVLKADTSDIARFVKHVRYDGKGADVLVEETLQSLVIPDLFGTPDALIVSPDFIEVVDLKTGRWPVKARSNGQLKTYIYLAVDNYGERDRYFGAIVQYGRVQFAEIEREELDEHAVKVQYAAAHPEEYHAGPGCLFCPWLRLKQCQLGMDYAKAQGWPEKYKHLKATVPDAETPSDADDAEESLPTVSGIDG